MGCSSSSNAKAVQEPVKPPVADAKPAQTSSAPPKKEETPTPVEKPVEEQPKEQEKEKEEKEKETQGNAKNEFEPLPVPTEEVTEHRERPNLVWAKNPMAEGEEEKEQTGGEAPAEGEKMISFNPILLPVPPAEGGSAVQLYCPLTSVEELSGLSVLVLLRENKIPHDLKKESIAEPERKMPVYLDDGGLHLWEANAALRYICTKEELTGWYPADVQKRAICDNALEFNGNVLMPMMAAALESYKKGEERAAEAVKQDEEKFLSDVWPALNHLIQSGEGPLLGGAAPSIADLAVFPHMLVVTRKLPEHFVSQHEGVKSYLEALHAALPSLG
ncbi:hypothetical protein GUITHDRAFT_153910, partial [Guillardia theta CCMP2712]